MNDVIFVQINIVSIIRKNTEKDVYSFCEEKVLGYLLWVFWYAESKNKVGKLKMASSLSNFHISKMAAK